MRKRVLFVAEGVTLAHVGRAIRLASILHCDGLDVELACDARYGRFLADLDFPVRTIRSVASETFLDALAHGRPVFSTRTLSAHVRDDLALLDASKPDAVVGDFRLSLSVSARVAGIPYANVTNAYWSPFARPRFRMPSLSFAPFLENPVGDALFPLARPFAFAAHAVPMNRVRRAHGLPSLGWDLRRVYCDGDLTLYADIPELIPITGNPPTHRYIGPVLWSPPIERPPWWDEVIGGEPPIYVSLGSSGQAHLLPTVIEALLPLERPIVVATAGRGGDLPRLSRVWTADFVPGEAIAARACAVVCNGGSPTCQQALVHGVPVVGVPSNLDQYLNMGYVQRFGAGELIRSERASAEAVRQSVRRVLEDPRRRERAAAAAALARATRPDVEFPHAIRALLEPVRQGLTKPGV